MNFLPSNYEAPKSNGQYMKFVDGDNRIRILSAPILGWEEWTQDKKPIRYRMDKKPTVFAMPDREPKHFWTMIVWNYEVQKIQIFQLTQAGIRKSIESFSKDPEWGAPYGYDIKINKQGSELKTKYSVNPSPHKPVGQHVIDAFKAQPINLEALFDNKDPFAPGQANYTPGVFSDGINIVGSGSVCLDPFAGSVIAQRAPKAVITPEESQSLVVTLRNCSPDYQKSIVSTLEGLGIHSYDDVTPAIFLKLMPKAKQMADEYAAQRRETVFAEAGF